MKNILIVNQHGENRGDEAAMRAMVYGINKRVPNSKFDIVCQLKDRKLEINFENEDVTIHQMLIPFLEFIALLIFICLKCIGIEITYILGKRTKKIITAYKNADIVISAPAGPYLGDIYSGIFHYHELGHWLMIIIANLYKKKTFLYAPSAGPFKKKSINWLRKKLFNSFDNITIREELSFNILKDFIPQKEIKFAADSVLQKIPPKMSRKEYFKDNYEKMKDKLLVSVSLIDYHYSQSLNPQKLKTNYEENFLELIKFIANKHDSHFILYPQLYGNTHTDLPILKRIGEKMDSFNISWEILDQTLNSDMQISIWGMTDFTLSSRFHPQIFSAMQGVPFICLYYEHKQLGFVDELGLRDYAFDIYKMDYKQITPKIESILENRNEFMSKIETKLNEMIQRSELSSEIVAQMLKE